MLDRQKRRRCRWTDGEVRTLKTLWAAGASASQISERFAGRHSKKAVQAKATALGLAGGPKASRSAWADDARRLAESDGLRPSQAACRLGVSRNAVIEMAWREDWNTGIPALGRAEERSQRQRDARFVRALLTATLAELRGQA